jgi:phage terminase small subunit
MALNPKQERFCREYVIDLDGAKAAIRAGYSKKTAKEQASKLLTIVNVRDRVLELQTNITEKLSKSALDVLNEYIKIGFSNIQDFIKEGFEIDDIVKLERDKAAAIESIQIIETVSEHGTNRNIKFKLYNKITALDSIGKHYGIFKEDNKQKELSIQPIQYITVDEQTKLALMNLKKPNANNGGI